MTSFVVEKLLQFLLALLQCIVKSDSDDKILQWFPELWWGSILQHLFDEDRTHLMNSLDMGIANGLPTFRLIPEQMAGDFWVDAARKLLATTTKDHIFDQLN